MAASVAQFHPDSAQGKSVWWGMLATRPDRRGAGLSLWLGAQAIVDISDRAIHGFRPASGRATWRPSGFAPSWHWCPRLHKT